MRTLQVTSANHAIHIFIVQTLDRGLNRYTAITRTIIGHSMHSSRGQAVTVECGAGPGFINTNIWPLPLKTWLGSTLLTRVVRGHNRHEGSPLFQECPLLKIQNRRLVWVRTELVYGQTLNSHWSRENRIAREVYGTGICSVQTDIYTSRIDILFPN